MTDGEVTTTVGQEAEIYTTNGTNATGGFEEPSYIQVWVTITYVIVFLVGVLGNILVILVVFCVKEMKTATNLCLMNLSLADLLVLIICQPSAMLELYVDDWLLGEVMCKLTVLLQNIVAVASVLIILTVSLERFWAVYFPLKTYSSGSKSRAMIIMGVIWLVSLIVNIPILLASSITVYAGVTYCVTSLHETIYKVYIATSYALLFGLPMLLLALLYAMIIHKVLSKTMECKQMTETAKSQSAQNRKQLVIMLIGIVVLFFICILPLRVLQLVQIFSNINLAEAMGGEEIYLNVISLCRLLIYINSAGNPIIYNIFSTKFRRAFLKVLRMHCCCCKKRLAAKGRRWNGNGTVGSSLAGTRMTTMSHCTHYSMVKTDMSESVDHV